MERAEEARAAIVVLGERMHDAAQLGKRHFPSKMVVGGVGQMVRLVDDQTLESRQEGVVERQIGEEQSVVDHHDVSAFGPTARALVEATSEQRVARRDRGAAVALQLGPEPRVAVASESVAFLDVAGTRGARPYEQRQEVLPLLRVQAGGIGEDIPEASHAQVVGPSLEDGCSQGFAHETLDLRELLLEELVLERARGGRDQHAIMRLHGPTRRRNEIRERLARARARLGQQESIFGKSVRDRAGHVDLRRARLPDLAGPQKLATREQRGDLFAVDLRVARHAEGPQILRFVGTDLDAGHFAAAPGKHGFPGAARTAQHPGDGPMEFLVGIVQEIELRFDAQEQQPRRAGIHLGAMSRSARQQVESLDERLESVGRSRGPDGARAEQGVEPEDRRLLDPALAE